MCVCVCVCVCVFCRTMLYKMRKGQLCPENILSNCLTWFQSRCLIELERGLAASTTSAFPRDSSSETPSSRFNSRARLALEPARIMWVSEPTGAQNEITAELAMNIHVATITDTNCPRPHSASELCSLF